MGGRNKLRYYFEKIVFNALPAPYFRNYYDRLKSYEQRCDQNELYDRLNYYFKINAPFAVPDTSIALKNFKLKGNSSTYYFDLKEFLHYFNPDFRVSFLFGDTIHLNNDPTLVKARPIDVKNHNSLLFKLNKLRHFHFVKDQLPFQEKKNMAVWRGGAYHAMRRNFVEQYWNHTRCNVAQTNQKKENVPWQKEYLSIKEHLKYQFICCPEGNDVATNLKWAMSSNSLCIMPKPKYETWFMEGQLEAGVHYVEVKSDFSDLIEKMDFYHAHPKEAELIINQAHNHVSRFKDKDMEDLLCLKVLEKYALLTGQEEAIRFTG